jgi:hypothetical protein
MKTILYHKNVTVFLLQFFIFSWCFAQQPPVKKWDYRYGGSGGDFLLDIQQTADRGYLMGGWSDSQKSGDKTAVSKGFSDMWIVKIDSDGILQWDKGYGGSDWDGCVALSQTDDGGYMLAGYSTSGIGGDKTEPSKGDYDLWIVKVDSDGNKQWDKTYGSNNTDELYAMLQTSDGGYIFGCESNSDMGGDKTEKSQGGYDYWVLKVDSLGNKQWDKTFGGTEDDKLTCLLEVSKSEFLIGGYSLSGISGDKSEESHGGADFWIVDINSEGIKQWDKSYGANIDEILHSIHKTTDEGFILGGHSTSGISGDKTEPSKGSMDQWIIKIDASGNKQWDKSYGGNIYDHLITAFVSNDDDGFILGGSSASGISGDKTEKCWGEGDYWFLKTDLAGNKIWDKRFGGYNDDNFTTLHQTFDGGYILAGYSGSEAGGDKTQSCQGDVDYWLVKTDPDTLFFSSNETVSENIENTSLNIFPNPNYGKFTVKYALNNKSTIDQIEVLSVEGKLLCAINPDDKSEVSGTLNFDLNVSQGIYFLRVLAQDHVFYSKIEIVK